MLLWYFILIVVHYSDYKPQMHNHHPTKILKWTTSVFVFTVISLHIVYTQCCYSKSISIYNIGKVITGGNGTQHLTPLLKILFTYLFVGRGREGDREGEKHQCVVASHAPLTGDLAGNPGICSRLGIKPATLWFTGQHSIHWATPVRESYSFFNR